MAWRREMTVSTGRSRYVDVRVHQVSHDCDKGLGCLNKTLYGDLGFWVLVVPGVIQNRQTYFNEVEAMWHLEGATLLLLQVLGSSLPSSVGG